MIRLLKNNFIIFIIFLIAIATAMGFILNFDKVTIHWYLNQFVGNPFLNSFFYYITYLGDGNIAIIILILILIYNVRLGIYATASFLWASLFSIFLKHILFDDVNRPTFIFNHFEHKKLNLVEGVNTYIHNSFPSGHSTQAFSIFMCLIFYTNNKLLKVFYFSLALFTAISRVYVSQHWLEDIVAGSCIGFIFSLFLYFFFLNSNKFEKFNIPLNKIKLSDFKRKK